MSRLFYFIIILLSIHFPISAQKVDTLQNVFEDCSNRIDIEKISDKINLKKASFAINNGKIISENDNKQLQLIPNQLGETRLTILKKRKKLAELSMNVLPVPTFQYSWKDTLGNPLYGENPIPFPGKIEIQFEIDETFKKQCPADTLYTLSKAQVFHFREGRAIATKTYDTNLLDISSLQVQKGDAILIKVVQVWRINFANESYPIKIKQPYSSFQFL